MRSEVELPGFVAPMLARASAPFDSPDYLFEGKWDGIRALAFVGREGYRLLSRHGRNLTASFPDLAGLARLGPGVVLDGELVVLKDKRPHLGSVQSRQHTADPWKIRRLAQALPVTFVLFDLLYLDYRSLMAQPLTGRRRRLQETLTRADDPRLVFSEGVLGPGTVLFAQACRLGLEGVMAKRLSGRYRPGRRSGTWLKIKPQHAVSVQSLRSFG